MTIFLNLQEAYLPYSSHLQDLEQIRMSIVLCEQYWALPPIRPYICLTNTTWQEGGHHPAGKLQTPTTRLSGVASSAQTWLF